MSTKSCIIPALDQYSAIPPITFTSGEVPVGKTAQTPAVSVKLGRKDAYFTATVKGIGTKLPNDAELKRLQAVLAEHAKGWILSVTRRGADLVINYTRTAVGTLESFLRETLQSFGVGVKPIPR